MHFQVRDPLCAKFVGKVSDKHPRYVGTKSFTRVRSPTDAQSATKPSTGAAPSTPTYGSTPGTNHTPAKCAEKDSTKKVRHISEILRAYSKRATDKRDSRQKVHRQKGQKADKRVENQSYNLIVFSMEKMFFFSM